MFGCLGRLLSALFFLILGAVLHAQWPTIKRELLERVPALLPAPVAERARTIVWVEVLPDRVVARRIG